jgi:hypothetical protein
MITLYLFYNIFSLIEVMAYTIFVYPHPGYPMDLTLFFWTIVVILAEVGSMIMINYAMWKFGFHYFNCGSKLSYYLQGTQPPKAINKRNRHLDEALILCNCMFPIAFGIISFVQ